MAPSHDSRSPMTPPDALWVGGLVRRALADHGLASHLEQADDLASARVLDGHGTEWPLAALVGRLRRQHIRSEWPNAVDDHVRLLLVADRHPAQPPLSRQECESQLRCQLRAEALDPGVDLSYARRFAPGILEVLSLAGPQGVVVMTSGMIQRQSVDVDDAFSLGRRNTDAEPVGERFQVEGPIWGLTGDSPFLASRVMNMALLSAEIIGPAPRGIAFAIPNRSLVLYTVMSGDSWRRQATDLIRACETTFTADDVRHPGGLLSSEIFYWSPDNRIESLGGRQVDTQGQLTLHIRPAAGFMRHMGIPERS